MYKIGKCRLQILLDERQWTQIDLAKKVGMTKQQINDYITGHVKSMSLINAKNISAALGCQMEELFEWDPV